MKTYEVTLKDKDFIEGPLSQNNLDNGADLLIPVPPPLCGVLIIGEETIVYCSASTVKAIPIRPVGYIFFCLYLCLSLFILITISDLVFVEHLVVYYKSL